MLKNSNEDVLTCGFDRHTGGSGSCYDYTVDDVTQNYAHELANLRENCNFSSNGGGFAGICNNCLKSWNDIGAGGGFGNVDIDVCRFTVLIALASGKIDDLNWVKAVDRCLGEHHFNGGSCPIQQRISGKLKKLITAMAAVSVLLIGIALIMCFVMRKLLNKRSRSAPALSQDASTDLVARVSGYDKISVKDIYAATHSLNVSNFIGQGIDSRQSVQRNSIRW